METKKLKLKDVENYIDEKIELINEILDFPHILYLNNTGTKIEDISDFGIITRHNSIVKKSKQLVEDINKYISKIRPELVYVYSEKEFIPVDMFEEIEKTINHYIEKIKEIIKESRELVYLIIDFKENSGSSDKKKKKVNLIKDIDIKEEYNKYEDSTSESNEDTIGNDIFIDLSENASDNSITENKKKIINQNEEVYHDEIIKTKEQNKKEMKDTEEQYKKDRDILDQHMEERDTKYQDTEEHDTEGQHAEDHDTEEQDRLDQHSEEQDIEEQDTEEQDTEEQPIEKVSGQVISINQERNTLFVEVSDDIIRDIALILKSNNKMIKKETLEKILKYDIKKEINRIIINNKITIRKHILNNTIFIM